MAAKASPAPGGPEADPGAAFICPDWRLPLKRPPVEPALSALRRLVLPQMRWQLLLAGASGGRGWQPAPFLGGSEDLDLEATLERLLPGRPAAAEDIIVRRPRRPDLRLLVLLDTSLSLSGPGRVPAAVAGGALARLAASGGLALLAFGEEPRPVIGFGQRVPAWQAAWRVLTLPLGGVTDLAAALQRGLRELAGQRSREVHTVLISDVERTAGPDPRPLAARYRNLHVLLIGERNQSLARQLARLGKGRFVQALRLAKLPQALIMLLRALAQRR